MERTHVRGTRSNNNGGAYMHGESEPLITKDELAHHLRFSPRWIEMQIHEGLPHLRVGSRLRFRASEVEAWFASRDQDAAA
jgi:excisionase family DNA binding protein